MPDYPYLRAWNMALASPENWTLDLARKERAPADAIYRHDTVRQQGLVTGPVTQYPETRERAAASREQRDQCLRDLAVTLANAKSYDDPALVPALELALGGARPLAEAEAMLEYEKPHTAG